MRRDLIAITCIYLIWVRVPVFQFGPAAFVPAMSLTTFDFSRWPPTLTGDQIESLTLHGTTYTLFNGLTYLPPGTTQPSSPSSAIHAPISLLPSPVPRSLFVRAQQLQSVYNILYSHIAMDDDFLDEVMGAVEGIGKVDEFTGRLWRGWKDIRNEGVVQVLTPAFPEAHVGD